MQGVRERIELQTDLALITAWHAAAFNGATKSKKGLPKLDEVLRRRKRSPRKKQTAAEMLANMKILATRQNALHARMQRKETDGDSTR